MPEQHPPPTTTGKRQFPLLAQEFRDVINSNTRHLQSIKPTMLNAQEMAGVLFDSFLTIAGQLAGITEQLERHQSKNEGKTDGDTTI